MRKIFSLAIILLMIAVLSPAFLPLANAADIRSNKVITIPEDEADLSDLYLFGNSIDVEAPVANDLVAAGQNILLDSGVSGNIFAAGANLRIKGDSGGSVRAVGGNIVIEGNVARDLLVAGGSVTITKNATVSGDLLIAGGELTIAGTVNGKAIVNGGEVWIEGTVGKQVEGNMGRLTLGPSAVIGGDLNYSSSEKAVTQKGSVIGGTEHFTRIEKPKKAAEDIGDFLRGFAFYKLLGDIVLSVLFIFFLGKFLEICITKITKSTWRNFVWGLAFLVLVPLVSVIFLILLWLGVASFLFYLLVLILALFLAKVFVGWFVLRWWYKRTKKEYVLDWKAGIVGPVVIFLVALIPVLGWLFLAILYLVSIGGLTQELIAILKTQRIIRRLK